MLLVALKCIELVPFYFSVAVVRSGHQMKTEWILRSTSEANSYCCPKQYPNSKTICW